MKLNKHINYWPSGKIWWVDHKNIKNQHHGISEYFFKFGGRGYIQTYKNGLRHGVLVDIHSENYIK